MAPDDRTLTDLRRATKRLADAVAAHEAALVAAYEIARSSEAIADAAGLSESGVRLVLRRHGVELRGRGRPRKTAT